MKIFEGRRGTIVSLCNLDVRKENNWTERPTSCVSTTRGTDLLSHLVGWAPLRVVVGWDEVVRGNRRPDRLYSLGSVESLSYSNGTVRVSPLSSEK